MWLLWQVDKAHAIFQEMDDHVAMATTLRYTIYLRSKYDTFRYIYIYIYIDGRSRTAMVTRYMTHFRERMIFITQSPHCTITDDFDIFRMCVMLSHVCDALVCV